MSDIEKFYAAIAVKYGCQRAWSQLHPQEQHQFIQGVNLILDVLNRN